MKVKSVYQRAEQLQTQLASLFHEIHHSEDYARLLRGNMSPDQLDRQYKLVRQHLRVTAKQSLGTNCWWDENGSEAQTLVITITLADFMMQHLPAQVVWELHPPWAQHHFKVLEWDKKHLNQEKETEAMSLLQQPTPNADLQAEPIETRTYIYNREASTVSDDEIFGHIQRINDEIKKLEAFDTKPNKLEQRIEKLKSNRDKLVKYVDSRN